MQFDLRKFIATGRQPYHAEFQCDLSAHDYAGARIPQPVTAVFEAETDGDEVRMTLRANASVHGECARCLDPVIREETVDTEWTVKERDLDDPDFDLPLDEKDPHGVALQCRLRRALPRVRQKEGGMHLPAGRACRSSRRHKARNP